MGGLTFGSLGVKVRGLITVRLSPYEQRAFAGAVSHGFPNMVRRVREEVLYVVPPLALGYLVYQMAEDYYERQIRKPTNGSGLACKENGGSSGDE